MAHHVIKRAILAPTFTSWYDRFIVDAGLESSVVAHYAMDEETGTTAADSSPNGNDGSYVNAPTLAQPPLGENSLYSVALNGTNQYVDGTASIVDYSAAEFTAHVRFKGGQSADAVFAIDSVTAGFNYVAGFWLGTTSIYVRIYDGATLKNIIFVGVDNTAFHDLVIRWDFSTITLSAWLDGVAGTPVVATGVGLVTPTSVRFGASLAGLGPLLGSLGMGTMLDAALTDAQCLTLSGG